MKADPEKSKVGCCCRGLAGWARYAGAVSCFAAFSRLLHHQLDVVCVDSVALTLGSATTSRE